MLLYHALGCYEGDEEWEYIGWVQAIDVDYALHHWERKHPNLYAIKLFEAGKGATYRNKLVPRSMQPDVFWEPGARV